MRHPKLVALDTRGGGEFVAALRDIWERGDTAFPVDQRLPRPAKEDLLREMRVGDPTDEGDALVLATSGTTGDPKGVVLTHDALAASALATSSALSVDPASDRWLACLPLAHIGGLGVVVRALHTNTPLEVHDGFDPDRIQASQATLVSLVPAVLKRIDPARFRAILLGGSAIPADRPPNAIATYGLTETGGGLVYDGRPLDGVELRIAADREIEIRAPMLLRCYRNGRDPKSPDGWFGTGDIGSITDGVLAVHGRTGDMIITGGENVWPQPVEDAIGAHPAVRAAAVIGRADEDWGERVVAVLELEPGAAAPALEEIRNMVKERLPAYCAPKEIAVVAKLPRTALGKLRRDEL